MQKHTGLVQDNILEKAEDFVDSDPREALRIAERFFDSEDRKETFRARRIAGYAARELQDVESSTGHFQEALKVSDDGDIERSRMMLSLAGNHALAGNFADAHETLDQVQEFGDLAEDGYLVAVQRASIFKIEDRLAETVEQCEALLRGDPLETAIEAHVLFNLGTAELQLGRLRASRRHLTESLEAYRSAGLIRPQLDAITHLALCEAKRMNIPTALAMFDDAKALADRLGVEDGIGRIDIARALLEAGLGNEARAAADAALDRLDQGGSSAWTGEAYLVKALALLEQGEVAGARDAALNSRQEFRQQQRATSAALANHTLWLAELASTETSDFGGAEYAADELAREGYEIQAQELRVKLSTRALHDADFDTAKRAAAAAARWKGESPICEIRQLVARAVIELADDAVQPALDRLDEAADVFERHQVTLGATELRARSGTICFDLLDLGLQTAFATSDVDVVWRWSERMRAKTLDLRPTMAATAPEIIEGLSSVREAAMAVRLGGEQPRLASAERSVIEKLRMSDATGEISSPSATVPPINSSTFFELNERIHRIDVDEDGHADLVQDVVKTEVVTRLVSDVRSGYLRWLRHRLSPSEQAFRDSMHSVVAELDRSLAVPVGRASRTIVVSEHLHQVPWAALPSLQNRPVAVTPSASILGRDRPAALPTRAVIAYGPGLDHAESEAATIAEIWAAKNIAVSGVEEVLAAMENANVAHLIAHGTFRPDSPMFSSLELDDGPLTVIDLERLDHPPDVVILSACDAGLASVVTGNESLGLVAALLSVGCRSVIAPVAPVADLDCGPVMAELHRWLRTGLSPDAALRKTIDAFPIGSTQAMLASWLVCYGEGS